MVVDRLDRVGISEREGNLNLSCAVRHHIGGEPSTKPRNFGEKTAVIGIDLKRRDRKSTRLNSSHSQISYAVFCLKKKNTDNASHDLDIRDLTHWTESTLIRLITLFL